MVQGIELLRFGADVLGVAAWQFVPTLFRLLLHVVCFPAHVSPTEGPSQKSLGPCRQHTQLQVAASEQQRRPLCMLVQYQGHFAAPGGLLRSESSPL